MKRLLFLQLGCLAVVLAVARVTTANSAGIERCYLEMAAGNCSDQIQRWYFDNVTGLCQPFTYTGCGGNGNNFNSTMYCYHSCNVSRVEGHSYSIEDSAAKLKGNVSRPEDQQNGATTPTDFSGQQPSLFTTRQPTLIRSQGDSGTQQQFDRQPVEQAATDNQDNRAKRRRRAVHEVRRRKRTSVDQDVGYDGKPEEEFADESTQWKNLKAKRYSAGRRAADHQPSDYTSHYSYYGNDGWDDEIGNSFRWRGRRRGRVGGGVDVLSELLVQMQHTAALLERFVVAATANRRSAPARRRPTPKLADEDTLAPATSKAEETARAINDYFRQRLTADGEARAVDGMSGRPGKSSRHRGDPDRRLLHVTVLGRLKRLPARVGHRRAGKPETRSTAEKSQIEHFQKTDDRSDGNQRQRVETERHQRPEVDPARAAADDDNHDNNNDDNDDDDIEVMSDRIRAIIADPASSFNYEDMTADDMVSLEEMASQSAEFGTMKLVEKDEDDDQEAAKKNDGTTTGTPSGGDGSKTGDDGASDENSKPAEQVAEAGAASDAANSDSGPIAL